VNYYPDRKLITVEKYNYFKRITNKFIKKELVSKSKIYFWKGRLNIKIYLGRMNTVYNPSTTNSVKFNIQIVYSKVFKYMYSLL
jgi:hypothetical protein